MRAALKFLLILAVCLAASPSTAETNSGPVVGLRFHSLGYASVDGTAGGYQTDVYQFNAKYSIFTLSYENIDYTWRNVHRLPFGDGRRPPWDNLRSLQLSLEAYQGKWGNFSYRLQPFVKANYEREMDGSLGVGAANHLAYEFFSGWSVMAMARFTLVNPDDGYGLFMVITFSLGFPEASISRWLKQAGAPAWLADSIDFHMVFNEEHTYYRLADDNPMREHGFLWLDESSAAFYLDIKAGEHLVISLGPEIRFSRDVGLEDEYQGFDAVGVDPAVGFSFSVTYRF